MEAKISITTACGAKCATCPSWKQKPETMSPEDFATVWNKVNGSPMVDRILINGTGDISVIPTNGIYFDYISRHHDKYVVLTTNGTYLDRIPAGIDELVISFNGGTKEGYEKTTGLPFDKTVERIKKLYGQAYKLKKLEIHCLIWKENDGEEEAFMKLWHDFPGYRRISLKAENQNEDYFGVARAKQESRIPCDYLTKLVVEYDGRVAACNHDWERKSDFGNLLTDEVAEAVRSDARAEMLGKHYQRDFSGICEKCNYNVSAQGLIRYV